MFTKEKHLFLVTLNTFALSKAVSFKPPSLPLAQLCVSTGWPLHTHGPPNQHHLLQDLKTQIKNRCHNHRKHAKPLLAGNKPCEISAADALFS